MKDINTSNPTPHIGDHIPRNRDVEDYILRFTKDQVPDHVFHQMKRCLLDLIGVLAAGSTTPLGHIITNHAHHHFGATDEYAVRLMADGRLSSPQGVALAGGMMIDSIDAHDGMRLVKGHAGCGVLPALIAMLEYASKNNGKVINDDDLLTHLTLGYEIAIRCGIALHQSAPDYHTSGAWVALSTAALATKILNGSPEQLAHAMGIAEYHGPRSQMMRTIDFPSMVKDGSGYGAMSGISAAFLAQDGFTGAPAITVTADTEAEIWSDLGKTWHGIDQYIKPWPVCRWAQPAVTAALNLLAEHNLSGLDVDHIEVVSFHEAVRLSNRLPEDTETAQYSLPWPVAAAVIKGNVSTREITEPFDDPAIMALAQSMTLSEQSDYNDAFPGERYAHVILTLKNGQKLTSERTKSTWDADQPPSDQDMIDKFHTLADPVLSRKEAENLVDLVFGMNPHDPESTNASVIINTICSQF